MLSNDLPKLEFLDIGHEFKLGSFQLSECSDELDSRDTEEILSSTPEPGMSIVKVFTSVPLEPNAKYGQLECSTDLEFSQIDDSTGNLSTRGHSMPLGTALECNLAHYEAKPHQLHDENRGKTQGGNSA